MDDTSDIADTSSTRIPSPSCHFLEALFCVTSSVVAFQWTLGVHLRANAINKLPLLSWLLVSQKKFQVPILMSVNSVEGTLGRKPRSRSCSNVSSFVHIREIISNGSPRPCPHLLGSPGPKDLKKEHLVGVYMHFLKSAQGSCLYSMSRKSPPLWTDPGLGWELDELVSSWVKLDWYLKITVMLKYFWGLRKAPRTNRWVH